MTVLPLYPMTDCRDGDSHSPNLVATYRSKKLDNIVIIKISEVNCFVRPPPCPLFSFLKREDESGARALDVLAPCPVHPGHYPHRYRQPAVHAM